MYFLYLVFGGVLCLVFIFAKAATNYVLRQSAKIENKKNNKNNKNNRKKKNGEKLSVFDEAVEWIERNKKNIKVGTEEQLKFYAYFKQAKEGTCNTSKPALYELVNRAKWDAWSSLGTLSKEEAEQQYVALLTKLVPEWNTETGYLADDASHTKRSNMGPVMSTFTIPGGEISGEKDIWYYVHKQNSKKVIENIENGNWHVNQTDSEGMTPLHLAADRGDEVLVRGLLRLGAHINHTDSQGQTALHVAAVSDQIKIVEILIENGADKSIEDAEGSLPADVTDDIQIKQMLLLTEEKS